MLQLFNNVDKMQLQYQECKIALMKYLKTEAGFFASVKSIVIETNCHPIEAYEMVEARFVLLFGKRCYPSFEDFLQHIKKLGYDSPRFFYEV